jgi:hypothetical protein
MKVERFKARGNNQSGCVQTKKPKIEDTPMHQIKSKKESYKTLLPAI